MIRNYIKVTLRRLWKSIAFTSINIAGLSTALAVCLLIFLYVTDERGYDKYNTKADRIYRIDADILFNNTQFTAAIAPEPMAPTLLREYPQVEQFVRLNTEGDILVKKNNQNIQDHNAVFADSTFFNVFTIPMLRGNPTTALTQPNSIVIDEAAALRYFNTTDVLGRTLYVDNSRYCKITGVIKNIPRQSHFHFHFIRPLMDTYRGNADEWLNNNDAAYILSKPGVTRTQLQSDVDAVVKKYVYRELETMFHTSADDVQHQGNYFRYELMPLTDIHLHSNKSYEVESNGDITYVYIFSVIAALILLIACVNFMNLSTARSANRAKEVGIRKAAGSLKSHLIIQFLSESVLLSLLSLLLSLGLAVLMLPLFNQLSGKEMNVSSLFSSSILPFMLVLILVVGLLAGSYPAFYLSSFKPVEVLKGKIASGFKNSWLRNSLVVFQFCISIILIVGTIVVNNQLDYIRSRKIGYNREQVLVLHNTYEIGKQAKSFRQDLLKIPGIENVTVSGNLPTAHDFNQNGWFADATLDAKKAVVITEFRVDENYIPTLGMEMATGRNFSNDFPTDSLAIIMNEAAAKLLGFKAPLNQVLYRPDDNNKPVGYHVIGVVKDFNFSSMHDKVGPLIMVKADNWGSIALRVQLNNVSGIINQIEKSWNNYVPGQPFSYTFMDNDFKNIYLAEQRIGKLFMSFAIFAIFIACLGLFGLVAYAAEQRTKEIGIRKVLGANTGGIVAMLSKDFTKLVVIASFIAFPLAWLAMNKWLQSFAYRINISWWVFLLAGAMAVAIALVTISFQTLRAAMANPVKSLKTE